MDKKPVKIELSNKSKTEIGDMETKENINDRDNINNNSNNKRKTIIIIIIIIVVIIIAFIFILLFVILKVHKRKKIPIIIDVDEGGDDMIAYTIANNSQKYDILGITTMSPEYCVDKVSDIWLRFLEYMNFDAKFYIGEDHPLVRQTSPAVFSHDYGIEFPNTTKTAESKNAVDFMYDTIKNSNKKVTLFLLSPLTNFAKVIQRDKTIIKNIKEIIIMGGCKSEGNMDMNPHSEYNIYSDAEAANIVFNCGANIKVLGTDVTHKVEFTNELFEKYRIMNTKSSNLTYFAMKGNYETWGEYYLHDPITVLYHLNNNIIKFKKYYVEVNTTNPDVNGTNYGTINFIIPDNDIKSNIEYGESIDLEEYWKTFEKYIKKY